MPSAKVKQIQKLHIPLTLAPILFAGVVYYLLIHDLKEGLNPNLELNLQTIVPMLIVVVMSAGYFLRKKYLGIAKSYNDLVDKLEAFGNAHIIECATYEFGALVTTVLTLLTGNSQFLFISIAFIGILLFKFPHANYIAKNLDLTDREKSKL